MLFDTHAHYDDERFDEDRDTLLASMPENNVGLILNPGCDVESSRKAVSYANKYPFVYAAVGIHPENIEDGWEADLETIRALAQNESKVRAIGEIGLDYYWEKDERARARQQVVFARQMELARALHLPVIVHDRDAHGDSLRIVCDYPQLRGVFHCYSGSVEMARELLRRGWYLGFDGPITYKNAVKALDVIAACPTDRMLLETDSPYLSPVPNRGKRNDSRNLPYIAARIAEIKGMTTEEVAEVTLQNGKQLFGL